MKPIYFFLIGLVIGLILSNACNGNKTVYTPEKSGTFDATTPPQKVVYVVNGKPQRPKQDKPQMPSTLQSDYTDIFDRYEKTIDSLTNAHASAVDKFKSANDSIKAAMYEECTQTRLFDQTREDTNVKIHVSGVTLGQIITMGIDYTVNPQKCPDAPKKRYFYGGTGFINDKPTLNASTNIGRLQVNGAYGGGQAWGVGVLYGF